MEQVYFNKESEYMYVANDNLGAEMFVIKSPITDVVTLNIDGDAVFDLASKNEVIALIEVLQALID